MKIQYLKQSAVIALLAVGLSSCTSKNDNPTPRPEPVKPYEVPKTYNFTDAKNAPASARLEMWLELDSYLKIPTKGTPIPAIDATIANNYWTNKNNPFKNAALNTSAVSLADKTADAAVLKKYLDDYVADTKIATEASNGKAGFRVRGNDRIFVNANGLENNQALMKSLMGSLVLKEVVFLFDAIKKNPTIELQKQYFDEVFGYIALPKNYDAAKTYENTAPFAERPVALGGYFAERGKRTQAGKHVFDALLKGRAAIGAKDTKVRDEQIAIILDKLEITIAAAAYYYAGAAMNATPPRLIGDRLHELSEGYGFIVALKYRPTTSKLTSANLVKLTETFNSNFYPLLEDTNYTKLKEVQKILLDTYGDDVKAPGQ